MIADAFEYTVRINVLLTVEEATLLKTIAAAHYDWRVKQAAEAGVINGLFNTATWAAEHPSDHEAQIGHPCANRDIQTCIKALEMAHAHGLGDAGAVLSDLFWMVLNKIDTEAERLNTREATETSKAADAEESLLAALRARHAAHRACLKWDNEHASCGGFCTQGCASSPQQAYLDACSAYREAHRRLVEADAEAWQEALRL